MMMVYRYFLTSESTANLYYFCIRHRWIDNVEMDDKGNCCKGIFNQLIGDIFIATSYLVS